jgi:FtsP/CotA-like multicopper oxidase with cupredoxin domain
LGLSFIMRSSTLFAVAAALPLGLAHAVKPSVITEYVTICTTESQVIDGTTYSYSTVTYGSDYVQLAGPTSAPHAPGYGIEPASSEIGYIQSPGYGSAVTSKDDSTTCTDESGSGYTHTPGYSAGGGSNNGGSYGVGYSHGASSHSYGYNSTGYSGHSTAYGSGSVSGSGSQSATGTKTTSSGTTSPTAPVCAEGVCCNAAGSRNCWTDGFDIDTDSDISWPKDGKVVKYDLEITNTTMALDGISRLILAVNGQYPGPVIEANWGDTLEITVKNSLQDNGTSIHWHGLRQLNSNTMDGTNGVTECPIAPGASKTYTFLCTQHGTSWYHSHYSAQYGDGIVGTIVINGPATADYDEDLGPLPFTEWYHETAFVENYWASFDGGVTPQADNGLINGTMVSPDGTLGKYNKVTLTKGKKYRLRLINTSVDNHFRVQLDGHKFQVITSDFVPITPYETDWLFLAIGQRYDVIITADQAVNNYWFRAEVQQACSGWNNNNYNIKSIFSYAGAAAGNPTTTGTAYSDSCVDESTLVPHVAKDVPSTDFLTQAASNDLPISLGSGLNQNGDAVVQWKINGSAISIEWDVPTLKYVQDGNKAFPDNLNIIRLPTADKWYYWIIQVSDVPDAHPIHLVSPLDHMT